MNLTFDFTARQWLVEVKIAQQTSASCNFGLCCRSAIPVCTAILAIFIEKKVPTGEEALGLLVLTLGVMVAVWEGSVSGSVTGLLLCCAGTVCNAAMMSTAGKVMSEKVDVLRLTFYTAPISCSVLLPLFLIREVSLLSMHEFACLSV